MSDLDSSAIRARCEAATPGPWEVQTRFPSGAVKVIRAANGGDVTGPLAGEGNREFIAHARSDIPALLDVNDRLLAEIERLNAVVSAVEAVARAAQSRGPGLITIDSVRAALATEVKP